MCFRIVYSCPRCWSFVANGPYNRCQAHWRRTVVTLLPSEPSVPCRENIDLPQRELATYPCERCQFKEATMKRPDLLTTLDVAENAARQRAKWRIEDARRFHAEEAQAAAHATAQAVAKEEAVEWESEWDVVASADEIPAETRASPNVDMLWSEAREYASEGWDIAKAVLRKAFVPSQPRAIAI